jgi:hypothetical protein
VFQPGHACPCLHPLRWRLEHTSQAHARGDRARRGTRHYRRRAHGRPDRDRSALVPVFLDSGAVARRDPVVDGRCCSFSDYSKLRHSTEKTLRRDPGTRIGAQRSYGVSDDCRAHGEPGGTPCNHRSRSARGGSLARYRRVLRDRDRLVGTKHAAAAATGRGRSLPRVHARHRTALVRGAFACRR